MYSTGEVEQDCSTHCVCEERASRAQLCFSCYPYTKHLLGTAFLVTPTAKQAVLHLCACQKVQGSQEQEEKGVKGCVCVRRRQKFQLFKSQVISLKKKNHNFYSLFPACFPLRELSFLHQFSSSFLFSFWHCKKRKKRTYARGNEGEMDKNNLEKHLIFLSVPKNQKMVLK